PRVSTTTSNPSAASASVSGRPRNPVPPAITILPGILAPPQLLNPGGARPIPRERSRRASENLVDQADADVQRVGVDAQRLALAAADDGQARPRDRVAEADAEADLVAQVVPEIRLRLQDRGEEAAVHLERRRRDLAIRGRRGLARLDRREREPGDDVAGDG